jgi:hypothetical protein
MQVIVWRDKQQVTRLRGYEMTQPGPAKNTEDVPRPRERKRSWTAQEASTPVPQPTISWTERRGTPMDGLLVCHRCYYLRVY